MPYSLKPDKDVLCQCGCIVKKYHMPKHLQTAKHEREMQGCDNVEDIPPTQQGGSLQWR